MHYFVLYELTKSLSQLIYYILSLKLIQIPMSFQIFLQITSRAVLKHEVVVIGRLYKFFKFHDVPVLYHI